MHAIIEEDIDRIISKIDFSCLKNKSILITGSSGLLGIYLVGCLKRLQKKLNISVYSWSKTEIPENLKYFFDFDCHAVTGDITNILKIQRLPTFDFIIHVAKF